MHCSEVSPVSCSPRRARCSRSSARRREHLVENRSRARASTAASKVMVEGDPSACCPGRNVLARGRPRRCRRSSAMDHCSSGRRVTDRRLDCACESTSSRCRFSFWIANPPAVRWLRSSNRSCRADGGAQPALPPYCRPRRRTTSVHPRSATLPAVVGRPREARTTAAAGVGPRRPVAQAARRQQRALISGASRASAWRRSGPRRRASR
jgi:hypothetical protein